MKKLIFIAVSAFCINAFADEQMLPDHPQAAAAGSVPPAQVQPGDNQANNQNAPNDQNTAVNPILANNGVAPAPVNNAAVPAPAPTPTNPDGTPLAASLDQNGYPITQVAVIDSNNQQQNPDNQGDGNCVKVTTTTNDGPNGTLRTVTECKQ